MPLDFCPEGWVSPSGGDCYKIYTADAGINFTAAQDVCRAERAELEARANAKGQSIGSVVDFDDESDPNGLIRVLLCLAKPMKYNGEGRLLEHISKAISVSFREL